MVPIKTYRRAMFDKIVHLQRRIGCVRETMRPLKDLTHIQVQLLNVERAMSDLELKIQKCQDAEDFRREL
jgi:hypothetical protein